MVPAPLSAPLRTAVAFDGTSLVASGPLDKVALAVKRASARRKPTAREILIFDAVTSEPIELDLRGTEAEVLARIVDEEPIGEGEGGSDATRGPGRPRLGVIGREVTLLPRHWEWLALQRGGASAALRRLVDRARTTNAANDRVRIAQERCYRFLIATLGGAYDFEEGTRALFAGDRVGFFKYSDDWPVDARDHARKLAEPALGP